MTTLWTMEADEARLVGSRCRDCGATHFPTGAVCRSCGRSTTDDVRLAAGGVVDTYTTVAGVGVAEVLLDDGVLVMGRIEPADALDIGRRVRFAPADGVVRFEIDA